MPNQVRYHFPQLGGSGMSCSFLPRKLLRLLLYMMLCLVNNFFLLGLSFYSQTANEMICLTYMFK